LQKFTMKHAPYARSFDLHGKTAVVTGGALGIGAACATRLAELGARVAILDTDVAHAEATAEGIREGGDTAQRFRCDLSDVASIDHAIRGTVEAFGSIDIVVNNAGLFPIMPALELTERVWDRVLDVNLKGAFFCSQFAARRMVQQGTGGTIVNIASIDAFHPSGALAHYDSSKGGLVMLTRALAKELAPHRIRVNAIAPGAIETPGAAKSMDDMGGDAVRAAFLDRIPLHRMGTPDDIARVVAFFVSDAADYVTGSTLVVDGGYLVG